MVPVHVENIRPFLLVSSAEVTGQHVRTAFGDIAAAATCTAGASTSWVGFQLRDRNGSEEIAQVAGGDTANATAAGTVDINIVGRPDRPGDAITAGVGRTDDTAVAQPLDQP